MQKMIYHLGVDIGSTTIKFVVLDEKERIIFKDYFLPFVRSQHCIFTRDSENSRYY